MREHDSARADLDAFGRQGDRPNQRLGRRAGQPRRGVMFCQPITMIARRIGRAGEVERVAKRVAGR